MRLVSTGRMGLEGHQHLSSWSCDASPLLRQDAPCAFSSVDVKRDEVFMKLVATSTNEEATTTLLQELCQACVLCWRDKWLLSFLVVFTGILVHS